MSNIDWSEIREDDGDKAHQQNYDMHIMMIKKKSEKSNMYTEHHFSEKGIRSGVDDMKDNKCHSVSQTHTYKNTITAPCESQQPGTPPGWVTCAGNRLGVL